MVGHCQGAASRERGLLVALAAMFQPAIDMPALWIVVSPVNDAATVIRLEHTIKLDGIACLQSGDAWSEVNIVGDQYRSAAIKLQDETLVTAAFVVIGQDAYNFAAASCLLSGQQCGALLE